MNSMITSMVIYKTTNIINNKIYIGKSKIDNADYYGSGIIIKQALEKYGKQNFKREVIDTASTTIELNMKERYWISFYDSCNSTVGYNRSLGGDGFAGITKETIDKIRKANTGKKRTLEQRKNISNSTNGKPKSKIHRKHLSDAWKHRKLIPFTAETLEKKSKSMLDKNAKNTYKVISPDGKVYIINNLSKFANTHNLVPTLMFKVANKHRSHHKHWTVDKIFDYRKVNI